MMDKCFQKCVTRPGSSLTGSEKSCLMNCRTAFSETLQIVQERVAKKLVRARRFSGRSAAALVLTRMRPPSPHHRTVGLQQEDTKRMAGGMH